MKLAIADPPYPPNLIAHTRATGHGPMLRATRWYAGKSNEHDRSADDHPDAAEWNAPARHRALLLQLEAEYDGWAIATTPDAVAMIYPPLPYGTHVMAWVRTNSQPGGNRLASRWEAVLVKPPATRQSRFSGERVDNVLIHPAGLPGFAGAKPLAWTRWVLDALGYDQEEDTVADIFPGSGAVAAAIAQGVLL